MFIESPYRSPLAYLPTNTGLRNSLGLNGSPPIIETVKPIVVPVPI